MRELYCLGICPYCSYQGLIFPIKEGDKILFICDEAYHLFEKFDDIEEGNFLPMLVTREDYMELEEFIEEMPELENEVFIFENGIWVNMKNKQKRLFEDF